MSERQAFRPDELRAFRSGTAVEWRNGSAWLPGTVVSFDGTETDSLGRSYLLIRNTRGTRTVFKDDVVRGYPGHIRPVSR